MTVGESARYRFGPRERSGALAGLRPGQILTVAAGLVAGVAVLHVDANGIGAVMALLVLGACVALATWPIAGRAGDEWMPVVVRWSSAGIRPRGRRRMDDLAGLRILSAGSRQVGVVHDARRRTLTAAVSLRGQSFALLGPDEQDRRVAGWSAVLASLARDGSPIRRVQWLAASLPEEGHGVQRYLEVEGTADPGSACRASYDALLSQLQTNTCVHDVVLTLQVRQHKTVQLGCDALERELRSLLRVLADADVVVDGVLSADRLVGLFERTYEAEVGETMEPAPDVDPWPMAMQEEWGSVRVNGLWHATYWVAEWPRSEVRSDFLAPLLLGSARATLSLVMEPLGPEKAVRKVEASRTADLADAELRRRSGFMSTVRHDRESEVLARRESELADGHASFRYSGYVTVSAPSEAELSAACDAVIHLAGQCRLVLRRLYGDQSAAYTFTLPLGRGLR
jgi:hypothetical protein